MEIALDLPDLSIGIFATPAELAGVTSVAAHVAAERRARLQAELLQKFPDVTVLEFHRMLLKCSKCEHAISVAKFMLTACCTQCGYSLINPDGMFHLAMRAMLRFSNTPTQDFKDFLKEIPRV